jgi:glycosyltransferase involved in cell wall biosynthesis
MTLVSVLMPAYDHERWIADAVRSVLAQTHADLELVVVDDGSTDGTAAVLASFDDPRLSVVTHEGGANRGLHASLRLAVSRARGKWLSFLASDDAWEPDRLHRLLATGARVAYSQAALMDEDGRPTGVTWGAAPSGGDLFADLLVTNLVPAATVLVHAEAFAAAGGVSDERFEDLDLMLRLAAREEVAFVAEPLARYRVNTTGIAAGVTAAGRDLAEYASAVTHVASWPGLPEHRREAARTAAAAWASVLTASRDAVTPEVAAVAARIEVAWGLRRPRASWLRRAVRRGRPE